MSCTQKRQLVRFPKVRILKQWFRHFNDHKEFHNEGNLHLFSLMALFSYANFRSNERVINGVRYMESPGQWVCKLGSLPRILRVHSKAKALEFTDEDRAIITDRFKSWRFEGYPTQYEDVPEFCYSAKKCEIIEKDYSLVPSRYIKFVNRDESVGYEAKMAELQGELKKLLVQEQQSKQDLLEVMKGLGYGIEL